MRLLLLSGKSFSTARSNSEWLGQDNILYNNKRISVIFPAYNEEKSIHKAISDFFSTGIVDELVVVNNNSTDLTESEARKTSARVVNEEKQGYGNALMRGYREATGDYVISAEPDGTFEAKDIFKLLQYADEYDVVLGSRTSSSLVWPGAKMNWFMRAGNWTVAKYLEYLHNGPCLTDVGCTMKLMNQKAARSIIPLCTAGGGYFSTEIMVIAIRKKLKCVEIPVSYKPRIGESKITTNLWKSFLLALQMLRLITVYRFKKIT